MHGMHGAKDTGFLQRGQRVVAAASASITGTGIGAASSSATPHGMRRRRRSARAAPARSISRSRLRSQSSTAGGVKAVEAVDDRLGVGADRRGHAGQRGGHVLQQFERAFAARPCIVGQRHDADVRRGERGGLGGRAPGDALDIDLGPIRKRGTDDPDLERGWRTVSRAKRGTDHLQVDRDSRDCRSRRWSADRRCRAALAR